MAIRHWNGTSWVPFNELLSRFGDANARPVIKHYQDGVFGLGWYPLRTIKRWDGTAWVNVWQARQPAPPPPPKPDPVTGITPPPPPPPPVQGPVIFNDEGVPMELNDAGEIVPYNQTPGNFDTIFTDLGDDIATVNAGSFAQQQALVRRNTGNLRTARTASITRTAAIGRQRIEYNVASSNITNANFTAIDAFYVIRLTRGKELYQVRFSPSRFAVNSFTTLLNSANSVADQFISVTGLSVELSALRIAIINATNQRDAEIAANSARTIARDNLRNVYNSNLITPGINLPAGLLLGRLFHLPVLSAD